MAIEVHIQHEDERGCGFRKPSKDGVGIYLVGPGNFEPCERLPFPLAVCPCCGAGIKFSRGFTWIDPTKLFHPQNKPKCNYSFLLPRNNLLLPTFSDAEHNHNLCPMCNPIGTVGDRAGLMWVGERYYPTPHKFIAEAKTRGISKKIAAIPRDFEICRHIIYLAHRKAYTDYDDAKHPVKPAVFMSFRPTGVELVIRDENNIPEKALSLAEQLGDKARVVKVIRETQTSLL